MPSPGQAERTRRLMSERIRRRGDLPGFAKVIATVLDAMRGDENAELDMTQTILSDPGLTQKVLRLSNSAMYIAFGQNINTVSRAILILGTDTIGHLAIGTKLIEELSKQSPESNCAHLEMEKALFAGSVARELAILAAVPHVEESVVCSILHTLGRLMLAFYMPEHWSLIHERVEKFGINEVQASRELLGMSLQDIGQGISKQWGIPKNITETICEFETHSSEKITNKKQRWLIAMASMSSHCANALCQEETRGQQELADLSEKYSEVIGVEPKAMLNGVQTVHQSLHNNLFAIEKIKHGNIEKLIKYQYNNQLQNNLQLGSELSKGITEMRNMCAKASASQLMAIALETIFKGLNLHRCIAFLHDHKHRRFLARLGFGENVSELLPYLEFEDRTHSGVIHASLEANRILLIKNTHDPTFAENLPVWWKNVLSSAISFLILPIKVNGKSEGFIYGDWSDAGSRKTLSSGEIALLNELRDLLVQTTERRLSAITIASDKRL